MSWTFDKSSGIWKCTKYSDLNYAEITNLAEYGQPRIRMSRALITTSCRILAISKLKCLSMRSCFMGTGA